MCYQRWSFQALSSLQKNWNILFCLKSHEDCILSTTYFMINIFKILSLNWCFFKKMYTLTLNITCRLHDPKLSQINNHISILNSIHKVKISKHGDKIVFCKYIHNCKQLWLIMIITSKDLYVTLKQETALTPCLRGILCFSYITFFRRLLNLWLRLNLKTGKFCWEMGLRNCKPYPIRLVKVH